MPRSRALVACAVLLAGASWTLRAAAQADGAPVPTQPEPPVAPEPVPPASPSPAPDAPTTPGAAPPSEPAPTPTPATPPPSTAPTLPPSGSFPLPPTLPPATASKPAPRDPPPPAAFDEVPAAAPPPARPKSPSEGLFEVKPGTENHPHQDEGEGTDQFKIGPVVGLGIPSVFSFGGTLKLTRFLGAGVDIGLIPKVRLSYYGDATLSYQHYDIYGRVYPFGGGFFLSGGAGYATVDGTLSSSYSGAVAGVGAGQANYSGSGTVRTLMLTALIGYFYTTSIGFSFGVDAGAQIPIAPSHIEFSSKLEPQALLVVPDVQSYKAKADKSVTDTLEKIGRTPLPTINLRIGWIL